MMYNDFTVHKLFFKLSSNFLGVKFFLGLTLYIGVSVLYENDV